MLTISSPNTDRTLLSITEMRTAAGVSDSSRDTELSALNGYVSAIITRACNVAAADTGAIPPTLRLETVTETFRWSTWQKFVALVRQPVVSISSVVENDTTLSPSPPDYDFEGQILYRITGDARSHWPSGDLVVTYSAGWETVPDDLKYLAIKMVKQELSVGGASGRSSGGGDANLKRLKIEGVSEREWYDSTSSTGGSDTGGLVPPDIQVALELGGYVRKWGYMR